MRYFILAICLAAVGFLLLIPGRVASSTPHQEFDAGDKYLLGKSDPIEQHHAELSSWGGTAFTAERGERNCGVVSALAIANAPPPSLLAYALDSATPRNDFAVDAKPTEGMRTYRVPAGDRWAPVLCARRDAEPPKEEKQAADGLNISEIIIVRHAERQKDGKTEGEGLSNVGRVNSESLGESLADKRVVKIIYVMKDKELPTNRMWQTAQSILLGIGTKLKKDDVPPVTEPTQSPPTRKSLSAAGSSDGCVVVVMHHEQIQCAVLDLATELAAPVGNLVADALTSAGKDSDWYEYRFVFKKRANNWVLSMATRSDGPIGVVPQFDKALTKPCPRSKRDGM